MRRFLARGIVTALVAAVLPTLPFAQPAHAAGSDPGYTLEACRNDGNITFSEFGPFVCPDNMYTTGNLKAWEELDLVPHRLTLTNLAAGSFTLAVGGDHQYDTSTPVYFGWDFVSLPVKKAGSSSSCPTLQDQGLHIVAGSNGGAYDTIQRDLSFTVASAPGVDCSYDYYQRLALGSSNYSGSSLQSYVNSSFSGEKRVPLPVPEKAQTLRKDMSATQDQDYAWNLIKEATPTSLTLTDTCAAINGSTGSVSIHIRWQRLAASPSGDITVITNIYANNVASRPLFVDVSDAIRSGTTVLQTVPSSALIAARSEILVATDRITVPQGTTDLNDIATATYRDPVVPVAIPGNTRATASATVQSSGNVSNANATVTDTESISGAGLSFSVAKPSVGSFTNYTEGTKTTAPVSWTSGNVNGDGEIYFAKTVYADYGTSTSSGSLTDTATLTKSGGGTITRSVTVTITSSATGTLTVTKTIDNILQGSDTASFTVHLARGAPPYNAANEVGSHVFTFTASTPRDPITNRPTLTYAFTGLGTGAYTLHEDTTTGWAPQGDVPITFAASGAGRCVATAEFDNHFNPATARVRKVTVPGTFEAGWVFTLSKNGVALTPTVSTTGTGYVSFPQALEEGSYTITETPQAGWDFTSASSECSFTVNYPADNDRTFSCTFTNTQRGHIVVYKHTNPAADPQGFVFTPNYNGGATFTLHDGEHNDSGSLAPCATGVNCYNVSEGSTSGWTLTSSTCSDGTTTYAPSAIELKPGKTVQCDFYNTKYAHLSVLKTVSGGPIPAGTSFEFQLRRGASATAAGTLLSDVAVDATHNPVAFPVNLLPGTYQVCEIGVQPGWTTSLSTGGFVLFSSTGDNSNICHDETVGAGDNATVTVDNVPPPGGGARTIGYWKNWSSCKTSGGHQAPVLDRTLQSMEPGGLVVGDLTLHDTNPNPDVASDCVQVVRLLNKSTIDTGAKRASDPAFNLAAQLVGALLNKAAGATFPPCAVSAVNDAEALLSLIKFDGITHIAMTAAQQQQANTLATALDNYNNFTTHC